MNRPKRLSKEEADTLLEGIRAREKRKLASEPKNQADPPATPRARNLRILLPFDLWKAVHHAAIDLDVNVTVVAIQALQEFVERNREPK